MDSKTTKINATVLSQTKAILGDHSSILGLSIGEVIDRLTLRFSPSSADLAAILVLDAIVMAFHDLSSEQINDALGAVLGEIRECLIKNGTEDLHTVIDDIEKIIPDSLRRIS